MSDWRSMKKSPEEMTTAANAKRTVSQDDGNTIAVDP
jgi:hypothetical protein